MNIENKSLDSSMKLSAEFSPEPHWARSLIIFLLTIILIILWSVLCRNCRRIPENRPPVSGYSQHGQGSGHAAAGDKSGSGSSENGNNHFENPNLHKSSGNTNLLAPHRATANLATASAALPSPGTAVQLRPQPSRQQAQRQVESLRRHSPASAAPEVTGQASIGRKGFYGIEIKKLSKVLFLIDTSSSMRSASRELAGASRLEVLKMELRKSIFGGDKLTEKSFQRSGGFILMSFSNAVKRFPTGKLCRYRNRSTMLQAEEYINLQLQASGGTMMKKAWQNAIEVIKTENIDEVFFLTDGQPGDDFSLAWLLNRLQQELPNRLKVHCIALGGERKFMRQLAEKRRGSYTCIP